MTEREDHLQFFLAISIVLHVMLFLFYLSPVLSKLTLPSIPAPIEIVEVPHPRARPARNPVPPQAKAVIPEPPEAPAEKAGPAPVPPPPPTDRDFKDVVEIPKPAVEQAPRDTRIHANYSQRVERPARARDLPIDTRGLPTRRKTADFLAKPALQESKTRSAQTQAAREAQKGRARDEAGGSEGAGGAEPSVAPGVAGERVGDLPRPVAEEGLFRREAKAGAPAAGRPGLPGLGKGLRNLLPTEERIAQLEHSPGGGRNNPYNPDLVPANATMSMDTLQDENVGYWLTVKSRIALNWDPNRLVRAAKDNYDQTVANFGTLSPLAQSAQSELGTATAETGLGTTRVKFTIAKDGTIEGKPRITQRSGSDFLDYEALRAVQLGYPFPPVPDRIARESLTLEWSFTLIGR